MKSLCSAAPIRPITRTTTIRGLRLVSAPVRNLAGHNTQGNHMVSSSPITRFKSIACARSGKNRRECTRK
jgi:hypothetical protein